jgi:bifunctional ADP-heptose synthase (sugar kinase/adenylyltransferase)
MLAALESTALITWFAEDTAERVMLTVRPDVYAKGGDDQQQLTREALLAKRLGVRAIVIDGLHARSTSAIIHRVRSMGLR